MVGIVLLLKQRKRNIRQKMSHDGCFPVSAEIPKKASLKFEKKKTDRSKVSKDIVSDGKSREVASFSDSKEKA